MTIAHDTTTVAAAYTSTGTQTTSHAGSASTKAVVVLIDQNGTTADEVSGVTYGGVAMTRADRNTEATEAGAVYMYYLLNPPTGTQNVAMTTTAATNKQLVCATMTGDPLRAIKLAGLAVGTSASASNPAWNIAGLTAGRKLEAYEVIHSGLTTMTNTPAAGWTLISSTDLGAQGRGFARQSVASSGTTLASGWSAGTADDYVGSSIAFWEDTNLVPDESSSFEGGTIGAWAGNSFFGAYESTAVLANSALHVSVGTKSLLVTWPTTTAPETGAAVAVDVTGLVNAQAYAVVAEVYVPTGSPNVRLEAAFLGDSGYTAVKDTLVTLWAPFTANSDHALPAITALGTTSGQQVWVDNVRLIAVFTSQITATGSATSDGSAAITRTTTISATGSASSSGSAAISRTTPVTSTGSASSGGSAAMTRLAGITATSSATSGGTAALVTVTGITGTGSASSGGSAAVTRTTTVSAVGSASSGGTAAITGTTTIAGVGSASSGGSAAVTALGQITGTGSAASDGSAAITRTTTVAAEAAATSGGSADVTTLAAISAVGNAVSGGSADIELATGSSTVDIAAQADSVSGGSAALGVLASISATAWAVAAGSAALQSLEPPDHGPRTTIGGAQARAAIVQRPRPRAAITSVGAEAMMSP